MDAATAKFALALPYALYPASPQLAALHASRTSAIPPHACPRCGSCLSLSTTVARGKQSSRAIIRSCSVCGEASSTTLGTGNVAAFPPRKRSSRRLHAPTPLSVTNPLPPEEATVLPTNTKTSIMKATLSVQVEPPKTPNDNPSSHRLNTKKKKSALQEMLQRNREKEKQRTSIDEARPGGLSAFLSTL
ncbi:hypothetical protein BDN70DRAFT_927556 [Pholiota conissans]|uniref:Uncharacterized protein n=1 Tax=Pholiota conissans TaxID=109636 RepID=A0A9P6CYI3_9AGAR|nr:hypothetical protein BDN70DRAFT_927556 [Pholiota conissans]